MRQAGIVCNRWSAVGTVILKRLPTKGGFKSCIVLPAIGKDTDSTVL